MKFLRTSFNFHDHNEDAFISSSSNFKNTFSYQNVTNCLRLSCCGFIVWAVLSSWSIEAVAAPHAKTVSSKTSAKTSNANKYKNSPTLNKRNREIKSRGREKSRFQAVSFTPSARLSYGQIAGLHSVQDALDLKSSVALVVDQDTKEILLRKNDHAVLPIASITKLMTGVIISESQLPLNEQITVSSQDVDTEKGSSSRLTVGATLSRGELLHLALMSSENRAAHALGRTYPGGMSVFVRAMNRKARVLGMKETRYVEPTGLSSQNQSSAHDLAILVNAAYSDSLLRNLTTSHGYQVEIGQRVVQYNNTNVLVKSPSWDIGLQKTGYIAEAGRCLVMQARVAGRKLIMVFLDSSGKFSRLGDAERVRRWVENSTSLNSLGSLNMGNPNEQSLLPVYMRDEAPFDHKPSNFNPFKNQHHHAPSSTFMNQSPG